MTVAAILAISLGWGVLCACTAAAVDDWWAGDRDGWHLLVVAAFWIVAIRFTVEAFG